MQQPDCTLAQDIITAAGDAESTPDEGPTVPERRLACNGRSITNPDYVEPPHVDTDDDFNNELIDSESEDEGEESSDFGDNGYVDAASQHKYDGYLPG